MIHILIFSVGLVIGLSLQSMDNQAVVRVRAYDEVHNELMDVCRASLVPFNREEFDCILENFNINPNHADGRDILHQKGVTLLGAVCTRANCHAIDSLLKKGANPNVGTARYALPILAVMASDAGIETQIVCLESLKAYRANLKSPIGVYDSDTPLHKAASQYPHIVPYLLKQNDMPVNGLGMDGKTSLMCALEGFRNNPYTEEAVRALLLHKASVSVKDRFDQSVWYYAERYDQACSAHNNMSGCTMHVRAMCSPHMMQLLKSFDQGKDMSKDKK
jgi:ankyrin repeat protein